MVKLEVIQRFLEQQSPASELSAHLRGSLRQYSQGDVIDDVEPVHNVLQLAPVHVLRLCDAFLAGQLSGKDLEVIGRCISLSDYFESDTDSEGGNRIAETLQNWSAPRIHGVITRENVLLVKEALLKLEPK